jgi:hypothetical protein
MMTHLLQPPAIAGFCVVGTVAIADLSLTKTTASIGESSSA